MNLIEYLSIMFIMYLIANGMMYIAKEREIVWKNKRN